MGQIAGIHHVTAIAGEPQQNLEFYRGVLGLRLVKLTVNYDDPGTYHLYFGDGEGNPGTILTFFPWPGAPRGRRGMGQATTVSFSIPEGAMGYWVERLRAANVAVEGPRKRFGQETVWFGDPDGLPLALVAGSDSRTGWTGGAVDGECAIRGLHSVTLSEAGYERTAALLTGTLGFRPKGEDGNRARWETGAGGPGAAVDIESVPAEGPGRVAAGTIHHVAFRAATYDEQTAWRSELADAGLNVTPVIDRKYFRSIYFREPGGVLFEIATDPPGFAVDETVPELGTRLVLPRWLEPEREALEKRLPPLCLKERARGA
jgi:glyoxalase family protein